MEKDEQHSENLSRQEEEIDVLKSIYGDEIITTRFDTYADAHVVDIKVNAGVNLRTTLPSTYPSESAPVFELIGRDILDSVRESAMDAFSIIYSESGGEVVLFDCVEWVKEHIHTGSLGNVSANLSSAGVFTETEINDRNAEIQDSEGEYDDINMNDEYEIYHGEPLVDRKSTFQAHVARVLSVDDVNYVLRTLTADRKIARATHKMYAYRILTVSEDREGSVVIADNDDDGEAAAGQKLAQLLAVMGADNVLVVVSRWYGGIHLGPDRFKHIANVARIGIEACGLCSRETNTNSSSGKKNKKKNSTH